MTDAIPKEAVDRLVENVFPGARAGNHTPLRGDASTRTYARVDVEGFGPVMLMWAPDSGMIDGFTKMTSLIKELGADTPNIYGAGGRLLALEDLGDDLLEERIEGLSPDELRAEYRALIDTLIAFQERAIGHARRDMECFSLAFDIEKLTQEIAFADEHFLGSYLEWNVDPDRRERMRREWERPLAILAEETETLAHRDLHSRNIICAGARRVWIDYQDARMGRRQYDLASLLFDPYAAVPFDLAGELADYYFERLENPPWDYERFCDLFQISGVQRLYKALGTYGYQTRVRGVDTYVKYIPRAAATLRRLLSSRRDLRQLEKLLSPLLEAC